MSNIEVGEYVRTKKRGIFKVLSLETTPYGYMVGTTDNDKFGTFTIGKGFSHEIKNDIVNHSKNIIDLIVANDYVNGRRVIYVSSIEDGDGNERLCVFVEETQDCIEAQDIKSIVTWEMMKSVEYRVE